MRQVAEGRLDGEPADFHVRGEMTPGSPKPVPVLVVDIKAPIQGTTLGRIALGPEQARTFANSLTETAFRLTDSETRRDGADETTELRSLLRWALAFVDSWGRDSAQYERATDLATRDAV